MHLDQGQIFTAAYFKYLEQIHGGFSFFSILSPSRVQTLQVQTCPTKGSPRPGPVIQGFPYWAWNPKPLTTHLDFFPHSFACVFLADFLLCSKLLMLPGPLSQAPLPHASGLEFLPGGQAEVVPSLLKSSLFQRFYYLVGGMRCLREDQHY